MQITVNGETRTIQDNSTVNTLITEMGLLDKRIAVEINSEIIPRSTLAGYIIRPGDRIEIVQAIGGG